MEKDRKPIEIEIDHTIFDNRISTLKSNSLYNCRPNSLESDFKLSKIRFKGANRLPLQLLFNFVIIFLIKTINISPLCMIF